MDHRHKPLGVSKPPHQPKKPRGFWVASSSHINKAAGDCQPHHIFIKDQAEEYVTGNRARAGVRRDDREAYLLDQEAQPPEPVGEASLFRRPNLLNQWAKLPYSGGTTSRYGRLNLLTQEAQPPDTGGIIRISSPSLSRVSMPSRKAMSRPLTIKRR